MAVVVRSSYSSFSLGAAFCTNAGYVTLREGKSTPSVITVFFDNIQGIDKRETLQRLVKIVLVDVLLVVGNSTDSQKQQSMKKLQHKDLVIRYAPECRSSACVPSCSIHTNMSVRTYHSPTHKSIDEKTVVLTFASSRRHSTANCSIKSSRSTRRGQA